MSIRLTIDTDDRWLALQVGAGSTTVPGDATLTLGESRVRKALDLPETLELVLSFRTGVTIGVAANWIFGKLKGRNVTLRIEEHEVDRGQRNQTHHLSLHRQKRMSRLSSNSRSNGRAASAAASLPPSRPAVHQDVMPTRGDL